MGEEKKGNSYASSTIFPLLYDGIGNGSGNGTEGPVLLIQWLKPC